MHAAVGEVVGEEVVTGASSGRRDLIVFLLPDWGLSCRSGLAEQSCLQTGCLLVRGGSLAWDARTVSVAPPRMSARNSPEDYDGSVSHELSAYALLPYQEVADRLRVSVRTVRRMVGDGELPAVYIRRSPRIREPDLAKYLNSLSNTCYNQQCVGLGVRDSSRGQRICQDATIRTASTNGRTQKCTGRASSTDAARELADLLGLPTARKPRRS